MKIQKTKLAMIKFQNMWRRSTAKSSSLDTDLYMNNLNNYPPNQKITLLQKNTLYNFRLSDILTIWNNALCYSITFSPFPKYPKNPYTNINFDKGHLTNVYFKLKKSNFFIPILINIFWKCSFNLDDFREEAFPILKEKAIYNYMQESSNNTLFYDIINMTESLSKFINNRMVSEDLSNNKKNKFISEMKPFLKMFLLSEHSSNPLKKRKWRRKVILDLKIFFRSNPLAGRRVVIPASYSSPSFVFPSPMNIVDNSGVFVFGSNNNNTEINTTESSVETYTDNSSVIEDENESYNEVLDDSDDGINEDGLLEEISAQNTNLDDDNRFYVDYD
jgi:hypothetical protein